MWVKVDDGFPEHNKVLEAGRQLGAKGAGRVIAIWLVGICYCNRNLTDGFLPEELIRGWVLYDPKPLDVAFAMSCAGLFVQVKGGYRFHDYDDYQPSASAIKEKRQRDRLRKKSRTNPIGSPNGNHPGVLAEIRAEVATERPAVSAWKPERSRARDPGPDPEEQKKDQDLPAPKTRRSA